jgi:hypothetical protein
LFASSRASSGLLYLSAARGAEAEILLRSSDDPIPGQFFRKRFEWMAFLHRSIYDGVAAHADEFGMAGSIGVEVHLSVAGVKPAYLSPFYEFIQHMIERTQGEAGEQRLQAGIEFIRCGVGAVLLKCAPDHEALRGHLSASLSNLRAEVLDAVHGASLIRNHSEPETILNN